MSSDSGGFLPCSRFLDTHPFAVTFAADRAASGKLVGHSSGLQGVLLKVPRSLPALELKIRQRMRTSNRITDPSDGATDGQELQPLTTQTGKSISSSQLGIIRQIRSDPRTVW